MSKIIKRSLLILVVICCCVGIGIWTYSRERIYYNEEGTIGNTAGNLYNGGLFCEIGDTIYFSNPSDDGALYSMSSDCTGVKKLSVDKAASINADEHYIYYSRRNYDKQNPSYSVLNFRNTGIYRINRKTGTLKMLYDGANGISCLADNTIYYQHYDTSTATQLHKVDIDGKNAERVSTDASIPASVRNNLLYYAGVMTDHYLHALNLTSGGNLIISYDLCYMPIAMPGGIYYISIEDGYQLCRIDYMGGEPEILVSDMCTIYNITPDENYIFYQIDGGADNRIAMLDLTTGITSTLMDGDYKWIHITSNYVFFRDYGDTTTYAYNRLSGELSTFHPPVID